MAISLKRQYLSISMRLKVFEPNKSDIYVCVKLDTSWKLSRVG